MHCFYSESKTVCRKRRVTKPWFSCDGCKDQQEFQTRADGNDGKNVGLMPYQPAAMSAHVSPPGLGNWVWGEMNFIICIQRTLEKYPSTGPVRVKIVHQEPHMKPSSFCTGSEVWHRQGGEAGRAGQKGGWSRAGGAFCSLFILRVGRLCVICTKVLYAKRCSMC